MLYKIEALNSFYPDRLLYSLGHAYFATLEILGLLKKFWADDSKLNTRREVTGGYDLPFNSGEGTCCTIDFTMKSFP